MAIFVNTAEGGTNGIVVSVGNSGGGSGNAFDQVTSNVTFSTAAAAHGSLGYYASGAAIQYTRWNTTDSAVVARVYVKIADPTIGSTALRVGLSSGSVALNTLSGSGRVQIYSGGNQGTSPSSLAANTLYRFELYVKPGSGNGEVRAAIYLGDSTTAWWDSMLVSGLTLATIATLMYGKYDSSDTEVWWDEVGAKTGTDATWGAWPAVSGAPTAVSSKYSTVVPGAVFTLSGAGSAGGSGNSITAWQWTAVWPSSGAPTLSGATSQTATGTAGTLGDVYVYRLTVTNSASMTHTSTTNILVTTASGGGASQELIWNGTAWV